MRERKKEREKVAKSCGRRTMEQQRGGMFLTGAALARE